jgi:hypothetical protein
LGRKRRNNMRVAKSLVFGVTAVMRPMPVKTAASFVIEDPGRPGLRSTFRLEGHLLLGSNAKVTEFTKATGSEGIRTIVSETDNLERWLPDTVLFSRKGHITWFLGCANTG